MEFAALQKEGEMFYGTKQYSNAAAAYSEAVRLPGINAQIDDLAKAAYCWALTGNKDSAFYYLGIIAMLPDLTYRQVDNYILTVDDFTALENTKQWEELKKKMFLKAYNTFSARLAQLRGNNSFAVALDPISLGLNIDSAFFHLNDPAAYYLKKKDFSKAYTLYKLNLDYFPPNPVLNQNMSDYYKATGDMDKAFVYFSRREAVIYNRYLDTCSNCSFRLDSAITADYLQFSNNTGQIFQPPLSLVSIIASRLLRTGKTDIAYRLLEINYSHDPASFLVYKDLASYYSKVGDTVKANQNFKKAFTIQYNLPADFFQPSFNLSRFLKEHQENAAKRKGKMAFHSEPFFITLGNFFLANKMYEKAEILYQAAIEKYPKSLNTYTAITRFYNSIGDTVKTKAFAEKIETIKYQYQHTGISGTGIVPDSLFDVKVKEPICRNNCPVIMIHDNGKWKGGLEQPFASLVANDGYTVRISRAALTKEFLAQINVLVLECDPLTEQEVENLNNWVRAGGSLLAMTHHDQMDFDNYLNTLGVQTGEVAITADSLNGLERDGISANPIYIVFSEKKGLLGKHSIIKGRDSTETIHTVKSFGGGKSIIGPPESSVLLPLSKSAVDFMTLDPYIGSRIPVKTNKKRSFGVAFEMGKGKVVVLSSALIITAELFPPDWGKIGMNNPGSDNKQFALNIVCWLTGYLK
jgi:tetratricopeptide (TPR) repeat protein